MTFSRYVADEIAADCADGLISRREPLVRLGMLGLSLAAATTPRLTLMCALSGG